MRSKLLVEYLNGDRQWRRHLRVKYARRMLSLVSIGLLFRDDARYDAAFWKEVIQANGKKP